MAFLPRRLCVRACLIREPKFFYETMVLDLLYVGAMGTEIAEVRETLTCDSKVITLRPARHDIKRMSVTETGLKISKVLNTWEGAAQSGEFQRHWLQPKEFVGILKVENVLTELEANDPRFMLYYGLLISRIDATINLMKGLAALDSEIRDNMGVLTRLNERFGAFIARTQSALSSSLAE